MLRNNPDFYLQLHQQVALGLGGKEQEEKEQELGILKLRRKLLGHAQGIVLETCIGTNPNRKFYQEDKITKIIGIDWVDMNVAASR